MLDPTPHSAWLYWPHVVLGTATILFAGLAIFSSKGSNIHRKSGQLFGISMLVAAFTAVVFAFEIESPPTLISCLIAIYGVGMGYLTLKRREGGLRWLEWSLVLIPAAVALFLVSVSVAAFFTQIPLIVAAFCFPTAIFFAALTIGDISYFRTTSGDRSRRFKRHAVRFALATSEVLRAPLMSFGPPVLGEATVFVYAFGPFLLVPLIYYLAMPNWLKQRGSEPAAA